jgi:4-hydroxyphenylacetate 3-monooxygenase
MIKTSQIPPVMTKLGRIAARASMIEAFLLAAEKTAQPHEEFGDVYVPNPQFLYSAMCMHPEIYEDIITLMRDLSGSAPITIPSSYLDYENDEIGATIRRYISSPGVDSEDHVKLMKLIWDMMSSEFAGRYHLYEMFYAGPPHVNQMRCFANYDFEPGVEMVDRFLDGYSLDSASDDLIDQVTDQA